MKEKPILFSTEMVQAILAGRKTQTRRVVKLRDGSLPGDEDVSWTFDGEFNHFMDFSKTYPYWQPLFCKYQIGDILWVRETWAQEWEEIQIAGGNWANVSYQSTGGYLYKADGVILPKTDSVAFGKWKPSIFMPREACRLRLKITDVRAERLQDISEEDCQSEGIEFLEDDRTFGWKLYGKHNIPDVLGRIAITGTEYESFQSLWQMVNGKKSWEQNPWVWVISFEKL